MANFRSWLILIFTTCNSISFEQYELTHICLEIANDDWKRFPVDGVATRLGGRGIIVVFHGADGVWKHKISVSLISSRMDFSTLFLE